MRLYGGQPYRFPEEAVGNFYYHVHRVQLFVMILTYEESELTSWSKDTAQKFSPPRELCCQLPRTLDPASASQPLSSDHAGSCHDSWRCMRRGCWRRRESKETRLFSQKPCCKTSFPNSGPASFTPDAPPVLRSQEPNRYFRSRKQWILANLVRKNVVCCHLVKTKYTPSLWLSNSAPSYLPKKWKNTSSQRCLF